MFANLKSLILSPSLISWEMTTWARRQDSPRFPQSNAVPRPDELRRKYRPSHPDQPEDQRCSPCGYIQVKGKQLDEHYGSQAAPDPTNNMVRGTPGGVSRAVEGVSCITKGRPSLMKCRRAQVCYHSHR